MNLKTTIIFSLLLSNLLHAGNSQNPAENNQTNNIKYYPTGTIKRAANGDLIIGKVIGTDQPMIDRIKNNPIRATFGCTVISLGIYNIIMEIYSYNYTNSNDSTQNTNPAQVFLTNILSQEAMIFLSVYSLSKLPKKKFYITKTEFDNNNDPQKITT